ncbi:uncharacterized protein FIBRA_00197 [Fibroporia radiculosa]|uniref:Ubiquitin 3 binding protein But2 C-terminal domain-containing protein n=1 Tax=Fibroporia radiculosa TaxID=599839 RepID=J7SCL1_9APHY|nr:uncharacterized protein FIBRA_00197 [Fibroporia radiculosa]CCL98203.1 predicted protein [Fibroporia radiculosa]
MLEQREDNIALLSVERSLGDFASEEGNHPTRPYAQYRRNWHASRTHTNSAFLKWATIFLCMIILIDLAVYLHVFRIILGLVDGSIAELEAEYRNPYVGLAELYASGRVNALHYGPITNVPRVAQQVSRSEPRKVFQEAVHRRWLGQFGTVSPNDRRLHVSNDLHTILQFRTMDYGMERCQLALRIPSSMDQQDFTLNDSSGRARLDVCILDATAPLNPRTVSWANRPQCSGTARTLVAGPGEEARLAEFPCPWGSLHTYEVSCAGDASQCEIDVWANRNGTWGIFMYQHQSI